MSLCAAPSHACAVANHSFACATVQAEEEWKQSHTFRPSLDEVSKRLAELSQPSRAVRFLEPDNLVQAIESERCVAAACGTLFLLTLSLMAMLPVASDFCHLL